MELLRSQLGHQSLDALMSNPNHWIHFHRIDEMLRCPIQPEPTNRFGTDIDSEHTTSLTAREADVRQRGRNRLHDLGDEARGFQGNGHG